MLEVESHEQQDLHCIPLCLVMIQAVLAPIKFSAQILRGVQALTHLYKDEHQM